ncbi:MAG: baeRF10 domain-containing protein [Thermodesulfobacteriota bacterium]
MITSEDIRNLTTMRSKDHLISSLYLRLWPDSRIHQVKAKDLIHEKRAGLGDLSKAERRWVEGDLEKIQEFVGTLKKSPYRGLTLFSCAPQEIWQVFLLPQPVRDLLVLDYSAYIRPLVRILDEFRRVCTLLIDRTRARIFEIFLGEIEEQTEILNDVPSKVREAGWYGLSERRIERHVEDHLHNHLKKVADLTFDHFRKRRFDWLLLGGHLEVLPEMETTLHSYLRGRLKRTFRMDLESNLKEVLDKTLELEGDVKNEEDRILVSRLADSLKPGGLGVSGIHETLSNLFERSVHTFLVEEGFYQEGVLCFKCGFMGLNAGLCPICHESMTHVPDIVDEAVATAIDQNCEVFHIIHGCGLRELGSIGALLRYKGIP